MLKINRAGAIIVSVVVAALLTSALAQNFPPGPTPPSGNSASGKVIQSTVSTTPLPAGNWNSVTGACTGNLSFVALAVCYQITGTATLGEPTSGYLYTQEAYPFPMYLYNSSGWNNSTSSNVGRTAAVGRYTRVEQAGQGDAGGNSVQCVMDGQTLAGATSWLANPACFLYNGNAAAGAAGQYLNLVEVDANDGGFDVSGIAYVTNLTRTNNTAALGEAWIGVRVQSAGTDAIDSAFSATGDINQGLDLANATLGANEAAITLSANQRIYGNATGGTFYPSALGTSYVAWSSSNSAWEFVSANSAAALFGASTDIIYGPTVDLGIRDASYVVVTGAASVATIGHGGSGSLTVSANAYISSGAVPTGTTGSCSTGTITGGNTAGTFTAPSCVAGTYILTALPTAPNGYSCNAKDLSTPGDALNQTASAPTTVTFAATTALNDVVVFNCIAF